MKAYGNLTNRILEIATKGQPEPRVGMDATLTLFSDRYAATVSAVFHVGSTPCVVVREDIVIADKTKPLGMGHQDWICTPNPEGNESTFRWNAKTGRWDGVRFNGKRWVLNRDFGLMIGRKDHYRDWSF